MQAGDGQTNTDIVEEPAVTPTKPKVRSRPWLLGGLAAVLLIGALAMLFMAIRPTRKGKPQPTAEDQEQLKYDTEQRQREDQKAAQLRNQPFLVRKEDDSQRQVNS